MTHPRILALFGSALLLGQERGNIEALAALKDQGCDVLCVIRDETWSVLVPAALDARGLRWVKSPYIEHRLPGRLHYIVFRNPLAFVRANWRFFRICRQYRPTHIHAFNQLYVLNFLLGLTVLRSPMIFRAGDEPTVHNRVWRALWRFVSWRADMFVANSAFVARSLCAQGVAAPRVELIYNAPPQRSRMGDALPVSFEGDKTDRIVFIGQISAHKGVHVLIEAFRRVASEHPRARLIVAGRISAWSGDAWARQLRNVALADPLIGKRVQFAGEVDDVPGLLSQCGIHVAPSIFDDPSPNVVMEAKQAACPSIVFPRGGMPELVENEIDGLVCCEPSPERLAEALCRYLEDSMLAHRHGQAALQSLARLGVDQFPQRWLKVYLDARRQGTLDRTGASANSMANWGRRW
jgi:glycosyltransferase involved in cell wall biosynthesis